ncbi:MAG TPA: choice-of-anchor V domain-containing protein [Longimicrobium sp.]|nr:choice-of-anchor V domain-containing protein [Longimicrobium sp.]
MSARAILAAAGVLALAAAATAAGSARYHGRRFPDGAPPGTTGGFGEPTCIMCHLGAAPNDPAGSLTIEGLPGRYTPGQAYRLIVRLRRADLAAAGFQLSARTAAGAQAGALAGVDSSTEIQTVASTGIQYAGHSRAGSGPGAAEWAVTWTAPRSAGPITFSAAANAGNADASPLGDYVYSIARTTQAP